MECFFWNTVNTYALIKTNRVKRTHQPDCLRSDILDLMKARENYEINGKMDEYQIIRNKISKMIDKANKRKNCIEITLRRSKMTLEIFGKYLEIFGKYFNSLVPVKCGIYRKCYTINFRH